MKKKSPLIRLLENIKERDKEIFCLCLLYTIITPLVSLFGIILPKVLISYLTEREATNQGIIIIVSVFFAFGALIYFLKQWLQDSTYPRITELRIDYIRDQCVKLLNMDYPYMESATFLEKYNKALESTSNNSEGIEGIYHKLFELPQLGTIVLVLAFFIGFKNPIILLAILVNIGVTTLISVYVQKYEYKRKEALAKKERRVYYYGKVSKDFMYGKDVRVYSLKDRIDDNFRLEIKGYIDVFKVIKNREYALGFITLATLFLSDLATYGVLTYLTFKGMSISDYSMYVIAASTLSLQMTTLSENITFIMREYLYVRDFYEFMDADLGEHGGDLKAIPKEESMAIEFKNVTFAYPGTDKYILKDFSLTIPKGQKLAIVGINGAGKTTFVKLLTGLFKVNEGEILINGININEYKKIELYKMFGAVFQEVNILALTIAQNIACTLENVDYKKLDKVLKQVGLYEKVYELKDNVNTTMLKIIDENGVVFSGGESQKLAIARALYKGGNCVIMDEPTAALDALAEAEIYNKFDLLTEGKTAIYISHRLASTKFCDAIALLDETGLREYGTHDELMENKGSYYDMFVTQGKYYQEGGESA
ncbi:ABC transporter ATP-binding protein [Clostridium culturomicium]|uniref:ABC transporter ATP-binding protein n=1 Tax=Clostridium culturomicium TaxID=1499683 RepID=UPI00058E138B|nr:ABC transporter ATP-binding protein [Clostridium culturomicium]